MSIYKACDIRGRFGSELGERHAERLATALSQLYPAQAIVVGGDGRLSTPALQETLIQNLVRLGWRVQDLGRVSTPLFYYARKNLGVDLGVMVTASHNPAHDNGFKLTLGALPVTDEDVVRVAEVMESELVLADRAGGRRERPDLLAEYLDFLGKLAPDLSGTRVVVDCAHGMGGLAARKAWEKTSAQVDFLFETIDGRFPAHAPNPSDARNLTQLCEAVAEARADLGVAYDGDADRAVFVDDQGKMVAGDVAIVLIARDALRAGRQTIVFDQKCSRVVAESIRSLGGKAVMERSGHTHIKRAFLEQGAVFAGELSGHLFFQAAGGDDGIAASLIFARILKESGMALSKLAASVPVYPITPDLRIPMSPEEIQRLMADLTAALKDKAHLERLDGLRAEFEDGWGMVRPSVTEPVLTARFEGIDEAALERVMGRFEEGSALLKGKLQQKSGG